MNRDIASVREPICGECAKPKARDAKQLVNRGNDTIAQQEQVREKQAEISRRLRTERGDQRLGFKPPGAKKSEALLSVALRGEIALFCLWFAQMISILCCAGSLAYIPVMIYFLQSADLFDSVLISTIVTWVVVTVVGFTYSYAMAIVFANARKQQRVKQQRLKSSSKHRRIV